jgi:hypothetical protein
MAQVSWSIVAIDKTRAAFASVNQGLKNLVAGGDASQKKMLSLGVRLAGIGSIAAIVGTQVRAVAENIRAVPGVSQDTIDSWDRFQNSTKTAKGVIQNMVASAGEGLSNLWSLIKFGAIAAVEGLDAAQKDLLQTDREAAEARRDSSGQIDKETESMRKLGEARKALRLIRIRESSGDSIMRRREEAAALEMQAKATEDLAKKNNLLAAAATLRTAAEKDLISLQDKFDDVQKKVADGEGDISRVWETATKSLRDLNEERRQTLRLLMQSNYKILGGDLNSMHESIKLNEKLVGIDEDRLKIMRKNRDMAQLAGEIMATGFENAVFSGGKLRDVLRGIGEDLARMVFRNLITEPLADAISGGIKGVFGGPKAAGGAVSSGTTYLVGENGPELFSPSSSGHITPNHQLNQGGSAGGTYYIDARGADRAGLDQLRQTIRQLNGSIESRAVAAVASRKSRGGSFAMAM